MAIEKAALQRELDLAAEALDQIGYNDLAEKVDYCNALLQTATKDDVQKIKRMLARVQVQCKLRSEKSATTKDEIKDKAQNAVLHARRAALRRKLIVNRLVREHASKTKQKIEVLAAVRERIKKIRATKTVEAVKDTATDCLASKIAETEQKVEEVKAAGKARLERLKRLQKAVTA